VSDAATLFRLLDHDNSGQINIHEFITGCYKLQGESRSLDMKIMQLEIQNLQESVENISIIVGDIRDVMMPRSMTAQVHKSHPRC